MATYVLVHGAFQGGWVWKKVATHLRAAGHMVYTPTLDGCAERGSQIRPSISMETHVKELVAQNHAKYLALGLEAARGRFRLLFPVCAAGTALSLTALVVFSLGSVRESVSLTRISAEAVRLSREGNAVVAYRDFHNHLFFYTENRVPWIKERPELDGLLRERKALYCLLEERGLKELGADSSVRLELVDRQYKVTLARLTLASGGSDG